MKFAQRLLSISAAALVALGALVAPPTAQIPMSSNLPAFGFLPVAPGQAPSPVDHDPNCQVGYEDGLSHQSSQIPPPLDFTRWEFTGTTNFNPCRELSYAELRELTKDPNAPKQYLLLHPGEFVGTTTALKSRFQEVRGATDDRVTID
ncbi:LppP/LprE family lipoprotein [Corynebacterium epidermidicanis]|uniref:LppP/LprE family lipoprotein n=1 Tax=Corynebacterium epidermidicanis TaxID=1050174 RepID=UPI000640D756|nr:LppP/LprE family lipoprotein [Corynebacterium epidermidicanis]